MSTVLGPFDFFKVENAARAYYPHVVELSSDAFDAVEPAVMRQWCRKRYGRRGTLFPKDWRLLDGYYVRTNKRWAVIGRKYMFANPDHAFEFKMYWG